MWEVKIIKDPIWEVCVWTVKLMVVSVSGTENRERYGIMEGL